MAAADVGPGGPDRTGHDTDSHSIRYDGASFKKEGLDGVSLK